MELRGGRRLGVLSSPVGWEARDFIGQGQSAGVALRPVLAARAELCYPPASAISPCPSLANCRRETNSRTRSPVDIVLSEIGALGAFFEPFMKKIGLALSGGGFRATLYHLGLVRFLRDAGILHQVTHITSVSGGSIMAAHLALNWDQYTGSAKEFDQAASRLLAFTRLNIRNRILRRFPLGLFLRWPRRLLGLSNRQLKRTGLLENQYETLLYGEKSLFELPEWPQLHILATNLSEGCLCSFNRDGLWTMKQKAGRSEIDRIRVGLATVSMAVAASSAFPGFFPPLELTGREVGARGGEFGKQMYTDGGVFDNLGVRMFRWLTPLLEGANALDGVLVSDVGKQIEVQSPQRGGVIRAALRASDILMDRVWQLEIENFQDTFGFVFARIIDVVAPNEDATALHPEVQRQAANIRTDLDAFSPLEISCLVRHGYCIGRMACRSRADLFGTTLPDNPPWDPFPSAGIPQNVPADARPDGSDLETTPTTNQARRLQASASRRIWRNLLSLRDWTSFIYIPLLALLLLAPICMIDSYRHSQRVARLIESISRGNPDFDIMSQLVRAPMKPFKGETAEDVRQLEPSDCKGFNVLQDARIFDLRSWNPTAQEGKSDLTSLVYGYRRLKVQKAVKNGDDVLRVASIVSTPESQFRFPPQQFRPKLRRLVVDSPSSRDRTAQFEVSVDLTRAPTGQIVDIIYEHESPADFVQRGEISTTIPFRSDFDAAEVTHWFLMPHGREYRSFQILRYEMGKPRTAEVVKDFTEILADDSSIIAYKLASMKAGYMYEVTWFYK
jgi:predicted acylesterase/phospholipase RssA